MDDLLSSNDSASDLHTFCKNVFYENIVSDINIYLIQNRLEM